MTRTAGFTLLEVLVATVIVAVVAALAWGGLQSLARAQQVLVERQAALASLQRGIGRLERDLRQAIDRPIRAEDGVRRPALIGTGEGVELTRLALSGGWQSPSPAIERLAWRCRDDRLQRLRWPVADRDRATPITVEDVLIGVSDCRWRYLGGSAVLDQWPGPSTVVGGPGGLDTGALPRAVELRFQLAGEGRFRRLLELPADPRPAP